MATSFENLRWPWHQHPSAGFRWGPENQTAFAAAVVAVVVVVVVVAVAVDVVATASDAVATDSYADGSWGAVDGRKNVVVVVVEYVGGDCWDLFRH